MKVKAKHNEFEEEISRDIHKRTCTYARWGVGGKGSTQNRKYTRTYAGKREGEGDQSGNLESQC